MPVSDGYLTFVLDQLRTAIPAVRTRRMFGGCGLYAGELFFAVISDDTLYLKVDDQTRGEYEARGMPPFQPMEGMASMNYSQLPEELLEEPEALGPWVERAIEVARRAKVKPRRRGSARSTPAKRTAKKSKRTSARKTKSSTKKAAKKRPTGKKSAKKRPAG
jgi:DNA transformation protein and related proteins